MSKPTIDDLQRQNALLASSLREFLRIASAAENDASGGGGSMGPEMALEGKLLSQWRKAKKNAEHVLQGLP
jgi:hypothetical protein